MAELKKCVTLTESNFRAEVLESDVPVLVDFWAAWCGPCMAIAPAIEQLADEYQGKAKIAKLNVDDNPLLAHQYSIRSIPAMLFFVGGKVVDQQIGLMPKSRLAKKLESLQAA